MLKRLRDAGHAAYFAGGCVRDVLLGLAPKDFDVATDAEPNRVRELFNHTQAVGAAFGVILVHEKKSVVEVVTFRTDGEYLDGRRPIDIKFATAEQDARRRDFTINGLFLDPLSGKIIDFVGGLNDLKAKVLRAIGDASRRFAEDHLRLLRAVRFAARFSLSIEHNTADAIRASAEQLKAISPERIAEEIRLMLAPPTRTVACKLLDEFGLLEVIFRFVNPPKTRMPPVAHDLLPHLGDEPLPLGAALAVIAIVHASDPLSVAAISGTTNLVRGLRTSLRYSNAESDELRDTLEGIRILLIEPSGVARRKRFLAKPSAGQTRRLLRALAASGYRASEIEAIERELDSLVNSGDYAPSPLITGDTLTAAGLRPGRIFKRVLDDVYDAQLEGRLNSAEEALRMALLLAGQAADVREKQ